MTKFQGKSSVAVRPRVDGKFLQSNGTRLLLKGVAYGTFAPDEQGDQFPAPAQIAADFAQMQQAGINTVRLYTVPQVAVLDEAARHDLRVMVGVPWSQHIAFLDDRRLSRQIRRDAAAHVRSLGSHPASLLFALGNEIPPSVVRWYGPARIERFLRELYDDVKSASPESLLTYVNFPPTEHLDVDCYDVCSFNVYLHREPELRRYLARLQQIAGGKPLLLAEAGADSIREGASGQADITAMHLRAAFEEGLCGAVAFSWTDEWWRGGNEVEDWAFGLVDRARQPKPALAAVAQAFADAPFSDKVKEQWPSVSVVVCAYNASDTLDDCLSSLQSLTYPNVEVIVVNDGSRDATGEIAHRYAASCANVRVVDIPNGGLSAARNVGLAEATGEIVAYTDADVRVDPDWLLVPGAAVRHVRRRRLGRTERRPARRPVGRAVRGPLAGWPDAGAAHGSHRRARAGLQHGVPPPRAAGHRRLQPRLPAGRRRRGRVLAAAGEGADDRLLAFGAGLAPPSSVGEGLLAAAGGIRRRRDLARRAPPGEVRRRQHDLARPHL